MGSTSRSLCWSVIGRNSTRLIHSPSLAALDVFSDIRAPPGRTIGDDTRLLVASVIRSLRVLLWISGLRGRDVMDAAGGVN